MKRSILVLILLCEIAQANDGWPNHPVTVNLSESCNVPVGVFMNRSIGMPKESCEYPLADAVVFQKLETGYLLRSNYEMGETEPDVIFLQTQADLQQGHVFDGTAKVRWIGVYKYKQVTGFQKSVWKFEPTVRP